MPVSLIFKSNPPLGRYLHGANDCVWNITPEGLLLTAPAHTRDPYVYFDAVSAMTDMGFGGAEPNTDVLAAMTVRLQTSHPGCFEIYYAAGDITVATPYQSGSDGYEGGNQWETVLCDFSASAEYRGKLHNGFRLDWSNYCRVGETMLIESLTLYESAAEAAEQAAMENRDRMPFMPSVIVEPDQAEILSVPGYYVCLHEKQLASAKEGNILARFDTLEQAVTLCEQNKVYGYRVADEQGRVLHAPYTLLQCDLLREGKYVTDYVRTHSFRYGDAPINPGIDCEAGLVSCDRLVCWILWRLGFIHQPYAQGVIVSVFPTWCEQNGFHRIEDATALEPGDVILVRPHHYGYPQHAFLFAGYSEKPKVDPHFPAQVADPLAPAAPPVPEMYSYRYDCGSNARIQSVQPSQECLFPGAYTPVSLWRPVATPENCVNYKRYTGQV